MNGMNNYFPTVIQVNPCNNYSVYVYFDDGKIVLYDISSKIGKGVFKALQDINVFKDTCTVMNGTLAWDISGKRNPETCIDIDVFTLYDLPATKEEVA